MRQRIVQGDSLVIGHDCHEAMIHVVQIFLVRSLPMSMRLDVEAKMHHVAVPYDVVLSF